MRYFLFFAYCLAAIVAILYYAIPIGGHVAGGLLTSMAGGWGYAILFAVVALVTFIVVRPSAPPTVARSLLATLFTALCAAAMMLLVRPAPPGHLALTIALAGLTGLMIVFAMAALAGRKG
ncbi:hypothetical protein [Aquisalinus flavus]|uniref:Uncharacterized protein n=1 Tax=Aquisalinus flavus TaxID=1526572 RepID=A0A8J2V646_9PROT|nr:hypothetical protein [Aquisalinus flavus]MBD0425706.1 hypothetical protein [Aquisalinus flavus]UNE48682.1 hypothetical protein FF099_11795 [Aquisalinus flavus]GGD13935.1 hypothetical protein GCM10011342_23350 [Aquisalinus flavus]